MPCKSKSAFISRDVGYLMQKLPKATVIKLIIMMNRGMRKEATIEALYNWFGYKCAPTFGVDANSSSRRLKTIFPIENAERSMTDAFGNCEELPPATYIGLLFAIMMSRKHRVRHSVSTSCSNRAASTTFLYSWILQRMAGNELLTQC
jgi:hypothetical protein